MKVLELKVVKLTVPEGVNMVLGQSHFIKTVEDIFETLVSSSPSIRFGIAFCESSGPALVRYDGNDRELTDMAVKFASDLSSGHCFIVLLKDAFPINILNRLKMLDEVARIYCATANPVEVILGETEQGRAILGVVDGVKTKGVEGEEDKKERHTFLRRIGYKR